MANVYDMIDTWNDEATTFTSIKMNVTDTASSASSLLMDLQVGGVSQLYVSKSGVFRAAEMQLGSLSRATQSGNGLFTLGSASFGQIQLGTTGVTAQSNASIGWAASNTVSFAATTARDLILARDAANTLAQRNSTNAQTFNLYNTYTDASNYERGFMKWNSNVLEIGTERAGTGITRNVKIFQAFNRQVLISASGWDFWHGNGSSSGFGLYPFEVRHGNTTIGFSAGNSSTASDAGIARTAAAQLKITNGSTGTGELIFIVPTTDPAIAGALWNNAGTLSISAG